MPLYRVQSAFLFVRSPEFIINSAKCKFAYLSAEHVSDVVSNEVSSVTTCSLHGQCFNDLFSKTVEACCLGHYLPTKNAFAPLVSWFVCFVRFTNRSTEPQADDSWPTSCVRLNETETWLEPHFCRIPWRNAANKQNHTYMIGIRSYTECPKSLIKIYVFWESYLLNLCYAYCLYIKTGFSWRDVTKPYFSGKLVRASPRSQGHNLKSSYSNAVLVVFLAPLQRKWTSICRTDELLYHEDVGTFFSPTNYTASQPSSKGILRVVREQICEMPFLDMFCLVLLRLFNDALSVTNSSKLHYKVAIGNVIHQWWEATAQVLIL